MREEKRPGAALKRSVSLKLLTYEEILRSIAFNVIGANIVLLLAVSFHANNTTLSVIGSAYYMAGLIGPLLLRLLDGKRLIASLSVLWLLSGLVSFGYVTLLDIGSDRLAVAIILFCYVACMVFRNVGSPLWEYLLKLMSTSSSAGKVIGKMSNTYQAGSIISQMALFVLMLFPFFKTVEGLVLLLLVGIAFQICSFFFLAKVPYRERIRYERKDGTMAVLSRAFHSREIRTSMLLRWAFLQITVVFGMLVPFMKVVLLVDADVIFIYTAVIAFSYLLAGNINKYLADRFGSKPLLSLSVLSLLVISALLALFNVRFGAFSFVLLSVIASFLSQLCNMLIQRLYSKTVPEDDALAFNAAFFFVLGALSLVTGLVDGSLADLAFLLGPGNRYLNPYSFVFIFAFVIEVACLVMVMSIREKGSSPTGRVARLLFSFNDLSTIRKVDSLEEDGDDKLKRKKILMEIGYNHTQIARDKMHEILASSYSPDTYEILRSLGESPNEALAKDLIALAEDDDSFVQLEAVNALSSYQGNGEVAGALRALLDDRWASVRSMAARSLALVTGPNEELLEKVNRMAKSAYHIDEVINFLIAKRFFDTKWEFLSHVFDESRVSRSDSFNRTRYTVIAFLMGMEYNDLIRLYHALNDGVRLFDELLSTLEIDKLLRGAPFYRRQELQARIEDTEYLRSFVTSLIAWISPPVTPMDREMLKALSSVPTLDRNSCGRLDLVTALYFALSLLASASDG